MLAAVLSGAAGIVHVAAAVPHFGDGFVAGLVFVLMGGAQLVVAGLLATGAARTTIARLGISLQVIAIAAWAVSRTVGLPIGHAGPEQIGLPGTITVAFEVVAIGVLAWRLVAANRPRWTTRPLAIVALAATALLAVGGTTAAIADLGGGHAHGDEGGDEAAAGSDHHHDDEASHDDTADGHEDSDNAVPGEHHDDSSDPPADEPSPRAAADQVEDLFHRHPDGTLHLHVRGEVHRHEDGSLHLHAPRPIDSTTPAPATTRSVTPSAPTPAEGAADNEAPEEDHTHAPGEEH